MNSNASGGDNADDCRAELLPENGSTSWRLSLDSFRLPQKGSIDGNDDCGTRFPCAPRKQRKVSECYKQQERLLEGFNEMETMAETGCFPGSLTEVVPLEV